MIEANNRLFARLLSIVPQGAVHHIADPVAPRFIATEPDEKVFIQGAKIGEPITVIPGVVVGVVRASGRLFAVASGMACAGAPLSRASLSNMHAGLLTCLGGLDWFALVQQDEIGMTVLEHVFGRAGKFEFGEILKFFAPHTVVEVPAQVWPDDVAIAYSVGASIAMQRCLLPIDENALSHLRSTLELGVDSSVAIAILRAASSLHWEHCVLELYRCLETFFTLPYVRDLGSALGVTDEDLLERCLEEKLGWRPVAEQALQRVVSQLGRPLIGRLERVMCCEGAAETAPERIARQLYSLRNRVAHARGLQKEPREWPPIVEALSEAVHDTVKRML